MQIEKKKNAETAFVRVAENIEIEKKKVNCVLIKFSSRLNMPHHFYSVKN